MKGRAARPCQCGTVRAAGEIIFMPWVVVTLSSL